LRKKKLKKGLLLILILIFIFVGIYGISYFLKLQRAEQKVNEAIVHIAENDYRKAIDQLKNVISTYEYPVVKAPAMFLLGEAFERNGDFENAIETHQNLIADSSLVQTGNWYVQSVISLSRLYRQGVSTITSQKTELLEKYLSSTIETIKEKRRIQERGESVEDELRKLLHALKILNFTLMVEDISYEELLVDLNTELGLLNIQKKEYKKAEDILLKLETPLARFGLARLYLETGEEMKGIKLLEQLLQYDNTGKIKSYYITSVFHYAENLYNSKKYTEAIPLFKTVASLDKNSELSELSLFYVAKYYYTEKKYTTSLSYIDSILSNSVLTKDEEALLLKGYIYYDRQEFLLALKVFHNFLKTYPYSERSKTAYEWKALCERTLKYLG
jgi:tetratricopeptide (TPR) repeat protein